MSFDEAAKRSVRSVLGLILWALIGAVAAALAFFLFFRLTTFELVSVKGPSMEPTFSNGDLLLMKNDGELERDRVSLFSVPESWSSADLPTTDAIIKRIAAGPGDRLVYMGSKVTIKTADGETLALENPNFQTCGLQLDEEFTLGEHEYFMAGDNREMSFDSLAAWCEGMDPIIEESDIHIVGNVKFRLKSLGGLL